MIDVIADLLSSNPFVTLLVILLCLFLTRVYQKNRGVPPGPYGLPWIGYGLKLEKRRGVQFARLCKEYKTDVLCISVFGNFLIVIDKIELLKEVFQKRTDVADRVQDINFFKHIQPDYTGILNTNGRQWKEVRRFSISHLRDFGMGRASGEEMIQEEGRILCERIKKQSQPFDPQSCMNVAVSNIICGLVFGQRFNNDDKDFIKALHGMNNMLQRLTDLSIFFLLQYKFARKYIIKEKFSLLTKDFDDFYQFVKKRIEEHQKNYSGETTDLIYCYLKEMEEKRDPDIFDMDMLESVIIDFFIAGSETTYSTLRWALLIMASNQEIQKKVQTELDQVIGDRSPSMNDKKQTPYTEAVLSEVQRFFTLVPLGLAHACQEDFYIKDYRIPKGTPVAVNIHSIHHDKSFWKNPDEFDPENFLADGKVVNLERLIPFSLGRRSCPGESLARMELYIFFANLLQKFDIKLETDDTVPNLIGVESSVYQALPFKLRMTTRN